MMFEDPARMGPVVRPPRRPLVKLLWMAVPVVVVIAAMLLFRPAEDVAVEDERKTLFSPMGDLEELPTLFSWPPYEGAARYRFELFDESMDSRHIEDTTELSLELPPVAVPEVGSWRVVPILEGTLEEAPTPLFSYRVR